MSALDTVDIPRGKSGICRLRKKKHFLPLTRTVSYNVTGPCEPVSIHSPVVIYSRTSKIKFVDKYHYNLKNKSINTNLEQAEGKDFCAENVALFLSILLFLIKCLPNIQYLMSKVVKTSKR